MAKTFLRTDYKRWFKLGKLRKKGRKWRAAKGKHSKIRRQRRGYPAMPSIGYKTDSSSFGKVDNLTPVLVHNMQELENASKQKNVGIILSRVGAKKKMEMIKKAESLKLKILNLNKGESQ